MDKIYRKLLSAVTLVGLSTVLVIASLALARSNPVVSERESALSSASKDYREITSYPDFDDPCIMFAMPHAARPNGGGRLFPNFGHRQGKCDDRSPPLIISVTHENAGNNHSGALNDDPNISSYMADFDYDADFTKWFDVRFFHPEEAPVLSIMLDTVNYNKTNVTGWPLRYGHLFVGLNDPNVNVTLDNNVYVEFDVKIEATEVRPDLYSGYTGRRIMLGALSNWTELPPRMNESHFVEVDLIQSKYYSESYGDPERPGCRDRRYDRCFYDAAGRHAEGRELRYHPDVHGSGWTHVRIQLADLIRELQWVSPPVQWHMASLRALYLGIESEGATRTDVRIRHYHAYIDKR